ncbi:MAG: NAD(P)H-dependent oxidoreductase subunit E [bacterium]|jgi:NADH-quinone oxidoreductase subunit E
MARATYNPATVKDELEELLRGYEGDQSEVIMVLQDIQDKYNWLPREALSYVARKWEIPMTELFHIATFYKAFSLKPRGKHILYLCMGTACHVREAPFILDALERDFGIRNRETTPDGLITLETVNCVGACALGPILVVDGEMKGNMTQAKAGGIIKRLRKQSAEEAQDATA